jgi:hypothetical protein
VDFGSERVGRRRRRACLCTGRRICQSQRKHKQ